MTRWKKWLIGTGLGLLLLVVLVNAIDWNPARPYIARQVTSSTGRGFEIKGDLKVHLSLWPRIIAHDIVMGNAEWSKDPAMARIKRIEFTISIPRLLIGRRGRQGRGGILAVVRKRPTPFRRRLLDCGGPPPL